MSTISNDSLRDLFIGEYWQFLGKILNDTKEIQEIRIRINQPVSICAKGISAIVPGKTVTKKELQELFSHLCKYSIYAYEDELKNGYITVNGGYRIGVSGTVVCNADGSIRTMKEIMALNLRIPRQINGAADTILPLLYCEGRIRNTLLLSAPGGGKTTLLRDMIRQVSNGNAYAEGMNVSVVDERSELAGALFGEPQMDLGARSDVMDACPKKIAMEMLIRSMAPDVIAVDELGNAEEMQVIRQAAACGIAVFATAHAGCLRDLESRMGIEGIKNLFPNIFYLWKDKQHFLLRKIEA